MSIKERSDDFEWGTSFPPSKRHLYPNCPNCHSNAKVAGIYYGSPNLDRYGRYGLYERLCAGDGVVTPQYAHQSLANPTQPMWNCDNCKQSFDN